MERFRKLRSSQEVRDLHAEAFLTTNQLILPYFVVEGNNIKESIPSLPNVFRFSIDTLLNDLQHNYQLGINKILLFGVIDSTKKDETGSYGYSKENIVSQAIIAIKKLFPDIFVITDVCMCGYTSHGHCGIINGHEIENDSTLPYLGRIAVSHAQAGADMVAPSAMMDGQVEAIRKALDNNGYADTRIMSYSAKFSSGFYGPFRDAAKSAPSVGNRKSYQMDYRSRTQPSSEVKADIEEGADWVMVKPAHTYLDVIKDISLNYPKIPLATYYVSGEYSMLKAAVEAGLINEKEAVNEVHTAMVRAGANYLITYYATFIAEQLKKTVTTTVEHAC